MLTDTNTRVEDRKSHQALLRKFLQYFIKDNDTMSLVPSQIFLQ
jgi:hypothetical protein